MTLSPPPSSRSSPATSPPSAAPARTPSRPTATRSGSCSRGSASSPAPGRPTSTSPTSTPRRSAASWPCSKNERHNTGKTLSQRLAAIHSLFRHAALRHPEHAALIARVLAIQPRKTSQKTVAWLTGTRPTRSWPARTARPGPAAATTS